MLNEYIELDYAGWGNWPRFTHYPSGDTCLKSPYMSIEEWKEKRKNFLNKYPNLVIFQNHIEISKDDILGF